MRLSHIHILVDSYFACLFCIVLDLSDFHPSIQLTSDWHWGQRRGMPARGWHIETTLPFTFTPTGNLASSWSLNQKPSKSQWKDMIGGKFPPEWVEWRRRRRRRRPCTSSNCFNLLASLSEINVYINIYCISSCPSLWATRCRLNLDCLKFSTWERNSILRSVKQ